MATAALIALPVLLVVRARRPLLRRPPVRPRPPAGTEIAVAAAPPPTAAPAAAPQAAGAVPVNVTVVGDSMAHALVINRPKGLSQSLAVSDGSIDGCDVFDAGTAISSTGFELGLGQCRGWAQRWAKAASDHRADVALVVIGAWDVLDVVRPDGSRLVFGTPAFDAGVPRPVAARHRRGRRAPAPRSRSSRWPACAPWRPRGRPRRRCPSEPTTPASPTCPHCMRAAVERNPRTAAFVSGPAQWCNGSAVATDVGYRWDGVHVYKPGATLIFQAVAAQLQTLAAS